MSSKHYIVTARGERFDADAPPPERRRRIVHRPAAAGHRGSGRFRAPAHPGRAFLLCAAAALAGCAACSGEGGDDNPEEAGGNSGAVESEGEGSDFSAMRTYYRTVVFADVSKDPTMFVPWDFENRADAGGIHRILRGWLGRGGTWRRFANEEWYTPPSRTPWRILPRGSVRLVMGFNDDLRELYYLEGFRDLSVQPGPVMAEWSGQRGDTYRLRAGSARLSGVEYEGVVVDAYAPRVGGSDPPSEWCLLIGDGSLYVLIADLEGPGAHRAWVLRDSEETFWPAVTITWDETRSFKPARREIPVLWGFRSDDGTLAGEIESTSSDPRKLDGEGLVLPVLVVHEVAGQVTIGDAQVAVRGFLRHLQR